jgi:hypothetical protein
MELYSPKDKYYICMSCAQYLHAASTVGEDYVPVCINAGCEKLGKKLKKITYKKFKGIE